MNEAEMKQHLAELAREVIPDTIDPWPTLLGRLSISDQQANPKVIVKKLPSTQTKTLRPLVQLTAIVIMALLLSTTIFMFTPQGRVWAQEFMQFFTRARTDTLPVQPWQLTPQPTLAPGTVAPDPASILEAKLSVNEIEEQSGFVVKEPTWVPKHLTLVGATYDPQRSLIRIFYRLEESNGLVLKEEFYSSPDSCALCNAVGASANVETIQIGDATGEYVQGVWKLTENGPVWENDPYLQTLRWQADGIANELQYMGPPERLTKEELVKIASSLQ